MDPSLGLPAKYRNRFFFLLRVSFLRDAGHFFEKKSKKNEKKKGKKMKKKKKKKMKKKK